MLLLPRIVPTVVTGGRNIRHTPAGNLLLSPSVLFSGANPAKVFHLLDHLNMACIKDGTFFDHQNIT